MSKDLVNGTVVITGGQQVLAKSIAHIQDTKEWIGLVGDSALPGAHVFAKPVFEALLDAKRRGVKIRFITEITRDNIEDCRRVMQYSELRHLDGIKGNFGASESAYLATATVAGGEIIPQMIFSTAKAIVDQNNYLIEMLWNKAIPAEARFRELEHGYIPEITELLYGPENTIRVSMQCFATVRTRHDSCGDKALPSVIMSTEPVKNAYLAMKQRGIPTRFITEVTKENLEYCKELKAIVGELRHLEGIKGNFGVGDADYIASAMVDEELPMPRAVHSTARLVIEQQQYFFETLWNKAVSSEARFNELERGIIPERTEIISGEQNIVKFTMEHESHITKTVENLIDAATAISFVKITPMFEFMKRLQERGVKSRLITEVTRDNINECKALAQISELRHLDQVHGNFGITDGIEYRASPQVAAGYAPKDLIRSTATTFVKQQLYFFDTLWEKAIPISQRIKALEEGKEVERIELISDRQKSAYRAYDIIAGTKKELLVLFGTQQALAIAVSLDTPRKYGEIADKGVKVRILVPRGTETDELIQKTKAASPLIEIRSSNENLNTRLTILISDRKELMSWELRDQTATDPFKEGGVATYTNFESLAESYAIIFDNLWTSTEIAENLRIANVKLESNEKAMKEFIDIAAHEIRTPIQPILGLAEVLKHSTNAPEQLKLLDAIVRNANRLHRLQEDILDVARIESNSIKLKKEVFRIGDTVSELIKDFGVRLADGVMISLVDNSKNTSIRADKSRLIQVISNLVNNAAKFTRSGTIEIRIDRNTHDLMISVIDTGTGIDQEIVPRLFTKFASKSDKGTGLGLFISKNIVEAHNGKLTAGNNKNGKGATVSFSIPLS